ncbi:MAG: hypothetical protein IJ779_01765 [Ruminococcus sp.]|nr:hypothetical protein [Ruminococcus sp.]
MWICTKCETYNEDHEQYCCICNAKKNEASVTVNTPQQTPFQGQGVKRPELKPAERITETITRPTSPIRSDPPSSLVRGSRDDLMESFGMGGRSNKLTTALVAVNVLLLAANILGRILLL